MWNSPPFYYFHALHGKTKQQSDMKSSMTIKVKQAEIIGMWVGSRGVA